MAHEDEGRAALEALVKRCVALAKDAGAVVRKVQAGREQGETLDASLKDPEDPRTYLTVADQRAQKVIVDGLRASFPQIEIIGEEDEDEAEDKADSSASSATLDATSTLNKDSEIDLEIPPRGKSEFDAFPADFAEVCVFVDPVDGTREFVEGRIMCSQTLIGVAWRGRPVAGVMGLPFHDGKIGKAAETPSEAAGHCLYGVVGGKLHGLDMEASNDFVSRPTQGDGASEEGVVLASSATVKEPALQKSVACIGAASTIVAGGCGNKVLRLLTGQADVALFNLASSLWDSCATEALLGALSEDAKLTALAGHPIEHVGGPGRALQNRLGVLATGPRFAERGGRTHQELAVRIQALPEVARLYGLEVAEDEEPQALDMVRDVEGNPLTPQDFGKMLGREVTSYRVNESDAVRFKQSAACRIRCSPAGSVFYKRVALRELPYAIFKSKTTPMKLLRDVKSTGVEVAFLNAADTKRFAELAQGCPRLALPYRIDSIPHFDVPLDSRFGIFLPDLCKEDGWEQYPYLPTPLLALTLEALARFHAFYWIEGTPEDSPGRNVAPHLWETGTYWHLGQQPKGQLDLIEGNWARIHKSLGFSEDVRGLGSVVRDLAVEASIRTHGIDQDGKPVQPARREPQTVVHGDSKSPNFLFKAETKEIGLIDFQWSGSGLAATDVAYSIAASCTPESLRDYKVLVDGYYAALMKAFDELGAKTAKIPSREEFEQDFLWAWVDLARIVLADHWKTITPEILAQREGSHGFNAYNKSYDVAHVFVEVTSDLLMQLAKSDAQVDAAMSSSK
ncbi:Inositol monophosphatase 3 [Hondaea fermentalgiana]|uniref:3'(2'),5'-bisphosphate nucleotidase n=1 Tax=Hondaea fermentalgiana TaxID=2315210 RepID=A0A2R5GJ67_9STRA|nr:Inositol monophosphatase 3 [Hondaea fermentalgiana]|eukprot:GBG30930.1 Inositol monophosphatase 3 [Hondaea fermentalgiana]